MTRETSQDGSIKLSKDEIEFYELHKHILEENSWRKSQEIILKKLFQEIHDYYDEQLGNGLTRLEIHNKLKPIYKGTPRQIADRIGGILIDGMIIDASYRCKK